MQLNRNVSAHGQLDLPRHHIHLQLMRSRLDVVIRVEVIVQANLAHARAPRVVQRRLDLRMHGIRVVRRAIGCTPTRYRTGNGAPACAARDATYCSQAEKSCCVAGFLARIRHRVEQRHQPADTGAVRAHEDCNGVFILAPKGAQVSTRIEQRALRSGQVEHRSSW